MIEHYACPHYCFGSALKNIRDNSVGEFWWGEFELPTVLQLYRLQRSRGEVGKKSKISSEAGARFASSFSLILSFQSTSHIFQLPDSTSTLPPLLFFFFYCNPPAQPFLPIATFFYFFSFFHFSREFFFFAISLPPHASKFIQALLASRDAIGRYVLHWINYYLSIYTCVYVFIFMGKKNN